MTFFYVLLAFIVGLLIGWFLWGRLRDELARAQGDLESVRTERDRLKSDAKRLTGDLESCANARADLERQLREAKSAPSSAAPLQASSATVSAAPSKPAQAKAATAKAAAAKPAASSPAKPAAPKTTKAASQPAKAVASKPAAAAAKPAKAPAAKPATAAAPKTARAKSGKPSGADDLRRLIGIGPVNERRLWEHGITTFAQIAGWTAADIEQVEHYLQFGGRVEREHWVEQAKLLAAGNETEFARRFPTASGPGNT